MRILLQNENEVEKRELAGYGSPPTTHWGFRLADISHNVNLILVYTRRARVAPKELFVLSGHPDLFKILPFCGLWSIIIDYEHNLNNDVFLTYLQNSQISPNSSKFCSFLAKSERFKRLRTDGRTEEDGRGRTEDGRTHSSNLRPSYTKSPFGANITNSLFELWSRERVYSVWSCEAFLP